MYVFMFHSFDSPAALTTHGHDEEAQMSRAMHRHNLRRGTVEGRMTNIAYDVPSYHDASVACANVAGVPADLVSPFLDTSDDALLSMSYAIATGLPDDAFDAFKALDFARMIARYVRYRRVFNAAWNRIEALNDEAQGDTDDTMACGCASGSCYCDDANGINE